ncbi:MAG: GNAT family N-acetyltransferase [Hydrogenophaga sp.]|uniref:GNAT family N-acetyltransferase n=1 Tax=Hydrogenophaga sp. TaxID=1904254 RepID=UPI003D141C56
MPDRKAQRCAISCTARRALEAELAYRYRNSPETVRKLEEAKAAQAEETQNESDDDEDDEDGRFILAAPSGKVGESRRMGANTLPDHPELPMTQDIQHQESGSRGAFVIQRDGRRIAEMTYSRTHPSLIVVDHTFVDPSLRGQGVARQLQDAMVTWARENATQVVPVCSYVKLQFDRDPSIRDVLARK